MNSCRFLKKWFRLIEVKQLAVYYCRQFYDGSVYRNSLLLARSVSISKCAFIIWILARAIRVDFWDDQIFVFENEWTKIRFNGISHCRHFTINYNVHRNFARYSNLTAVYLSII